MIIVEKTIISDDIVEAQFVCPLEKCKGACCIDGDSGAPLNDDERPIMDQIYPAVEPYMSREGKEEIQKQGKYIKDSDGDWVTPLIAEQECAYVVFENGIAMCAIEKAYLDGKISFKKPISCHLYPIRVSAHKEYEALNYERRDSCAPACSNGKRLKVKVYEFLKEPLVRKYGQDWYDQLTAADAYMHRDTESE
jgi:hypothetical protein